jgi:hypothetical protein
LAQIEADITRGKWTDPDAGNVNFGEYADNWLRDRELAARTRERYEGVIRLHLRPKLGKATLAAITPAKVRSWRTDLLDAGVGAPTVANGRQVARATDPDAG